MGGVPTAVRKTAGQPRADDVHEKKKEEKREKKKQKLEESAELKGVAAQEAAPQQTL